MIARTRSARSWLYAIAIQSPRDIKLFTELTGDRNPLHYDEEAARTWRFEARENKPISRLRTTITNQDTPVLLDGTALVWKEPLP